MESSSMQFDCTSPYSLNKYFRIFSLNFKFKYFCWFQTGMQNSFFFNTVSHRNISELYIICKNWPCTYGKISSKGSICLLLFLSSLHMPHWIEMLKSSFCDATEEREAPVLPARASQQLSVNYLLPAGRNGAAGSRGSCRWRDGWCNRLEDNDKK